MNNIFITDLTTSVMGYDPAWASTRRQAETLKTVLENSFVSLETVKEHAAALDCLECTDGEDEEAYDAAKSKVERIEEIMRNHEDTLPQDAERFIGVAFVDCSNNTYYDLYPGRASYSSPGSSGGLSGSGFMAALANLWAAIS